MLSLAAVLRASLRLQRFLPPTPLQAAPFIAAQHWLKLESENKTRSFKIRGALNAVLSLDDAARARGIIAASSGNHAAAVAFAAQLSACQATIYMPRSTARTKVEQVQRYDAEAVLFGDNYDETEAEALRQAADGRSWISPYNNADVVAGAGTITLELLQQAPKLQRIVVPVSGGGLIAGIALAAKALQPAISIIGVNALSAPAMANVFHSTDLPQHWDTLADALSGDIEAGSLTVPLVRQYVDDMLLVSEAQIAAAMRVMMAQGITLEGGGAVALAAVMAGMLAHDSRETAIILSGGNVDSGVLQRVLAA